MSDEMMRARRRRAPSGPAGIRWALVACWLSLPQLLFAGSVSAEGPLDDASPSSAGLPGKELIRDVLSWGMYLGLGACGAAILFGGATWAGFGSASAGRAVHGKTYVIAGLIGAAVIGLAPTAVNMLFEAGSS